jgi:hypothetical protein
MENNGNQNDKDRGFYPINNPPFQNLPTYPPNTTAYPTPIAYNPPAYPSYPPTSGFDGNYNQYPSYSNNPAQFQPQQPANYVFDPINIPLPPPVDANGFVQDYSRSPHFYNNMNYYWHHGHWWTVPHSHGYFSTPSFSNWYFNRWGSNYGGVHHGPHCGIPSSSFHNSYHWNHNYHSSPFTGLLNMALGMSGMGHQSSHHGHHNSHHHSHHNHGHHGHF